MTQSGQLRRSFQRLEHAPTRILAYCVMPNHWHFVLWPRADGELTAFCPRLAHAHTQRRHPHMV